MTARSLTRWRRSLASGVALVAAACGAPPSGDGPVASSAAPVIGGVASTTLQNYVVQLTHSVTGGTLVCSGTLVAPDLVLTARHCVSATTDAPFTCDTSGNGSAGGAITGDYDPTTVDVYVGVEAPNGFTAPAAHGTRLFHDGATNICDHDLALLAIDPPVTGVTVAAIDVDTKPTVGESLAVIGWGVTASGLPPNVRQQRAGVPIIAIGPATDPPGYDVAPSELDVGESICVGDSGGPAVDPSGAVVGVASRGGNGVTDASANDPAATCTGPGAVNLYSETYAFRDVILGAFTSVGATPTLAGVALGEACTTSASCGSGLCASVGRDAGEVCTTSCASGACPSGFACVVSSGASLCAAAPAGGCRVAPVDDERGMALGALGLAVCVLSARARRRTRG